MMLFILARNCVAVTVILFCSFIIFAQENALPQNFDPTMLDEFRKLNSEQLEARLDFAAIQMMQSDPNNLLYIRVKRDKNTTLGFPYRYAAKIKTYLVENRRIDENRIRTSDGGLNEIQSIELWLQPAGFESYFYAPPESSINTNQSFLFDSFWYPSPNDGGTCCEVDNYKTEEKQASINAFATLLKKDQTAKAYLIYYPARLRDTGRKDTLQFAQRALEKEKDYLIKNHEITSDRIKIVRGVYQNYSDFQLWFVPSDGSNPPIKKALIPKIIKSKNIKVRGKGARITNP